jgi:hypothetical protein
VKRSTLFTRAVVTLGVGIGLLSPGLTPPATAEDAVGRLGASTVVAPEAITMSTKRIRTLATQATVWALAPEFVYRFAQYNYLVNAPVNELKYGQNAAAWNNSGSNAGDSSVMYVNGFIDFNKTDELVLTIPPSDGNYFVVNYLDSFVNTIASMGNRTTPSSTPTSYLLVSPESEYAGRNYVTIDGYRYPVIASDTMLNWLVVRVRADALAAASSPASTTSIYENVVKQFFLNPLADFQANANAPIPPDSYVYTPTQEQIEAAEAYRNAPSEATDFFDQAGLSLRMSPPPQGKIGLSGKRLDDVPDWIVPQYGATKRYIVPSFGQNGYLDRFAKIGLSTDGFTLPEQWGSKQIAAFKKGFKRGMQRVAKAAAGGAPPAANNYWTYDNTMIGHYANTAAGYLVRATVVVLGGSANVPADAVYPVLNTADGSNQLDGNDTYSITFTPPEAATSLPAVGVIPPMVTDDNGATAGFWAVSVYQPDSSQSAAPFLPQAAVINDHYTRIDSDIVAVDADADTITVEPAAWGLLAASSPVVFGAGADAIGLEPDTVYYLTDAPVTLPDGTQTISISASWSQGISDGGVPIQNSGVAGPVSDIRDPASSELPPWGMVQPVSQLGSQQIASGDLVFNEDGSVTLWIGPGIPADAPASNWIPTPSTALYEQWYPGQDLNTGVRVMLRMYYPTPGDAPPSILPPTDGSTLKATYVPPALVEASG